MAINLGQNSIQGIKLGTTQVEKVYLGNELIFESGGGDSNLLTEPTEFTANGVTWTWNKFDAKGSGKYSASGGRMTDILPLKETLESGTKCRFSIKEPLPYGLRITLTGDTVVRLVIDAGKTSVEATISGSGVSVTNFQIFNLAQRGTVIDDTIKGFKLEKVS